MDLNFCTYCDKAVPPAFSNSLYCSEECLRNDALNRHPMLGYNYEDLQDFPRRSGSSGSLNQRYAAASPYIAAPMPSPPLSGYRVVFSGKISPAGPFDLAMPHNGRQSAANLGIDMRPRY